MNDSRYASRKFILACAAFLAALALFIAGKMNADQWIGVTTWLVGLYLTGNIAQAALGKSPKEKKELV